MKKVFFVTVFSCITSMLLAQNNEAEGTTDSLEIKIVTLPDSTRIIAAEGKLVNKEIGPDGGMIVSDDGRLTLIVPPEALTKATEISIQPAECLIPNGNKAYQFGPSGTRFQKPVQIIFQYPDEEAETCPPELKFMALQDHNGKWEYMNYDDWDSTSRSLKGMISHFSAMVDGNLVELDATNLTIKVGKPHVFALNVVQLPPPPPNDPNEDELPPLPRTINRGAREAMWQVNGKKGGSAKHGSITPTRQQAVRATYRAPAVLTTDSIIVKLTLNDVFTEQVVSRIARRGRMTRTVSRRSPVATFACKVKLYDEYKVTVSQHIDLNDAKMTDTSTFNLKIGIEDRASISEISNQLAKLSIRQSRCRAIYVNAATCVGMINVTGLKTSYIRPAPSGDFVWVDLSFMPAPSMFPVINFPPCGSNRASPTTPSVVTQNAFPMRFSFQAKNEKQYISLGKGNGAVVSRPDPEDITAAIEPVRDE